MHPYRKDTKRGGRTHFFTRADHQRHSEYQQFKRDIRARLKARRLDSLQDLPHNHLLFAVHDWIAARAGLLQ